MGGKTKWSGMEQVSRKKSLLLLGSTGFLGSAFVNRLKSEHLQDLEILISLSSPPEEPILFARLDSDLEVLSKFDSSILGDLLNTDVIVVNCASSRNSKNEELSKQSNFEFPRSVLGSLLSIEGINLQWIQIETFWQYSKTIIPDQNYVFWKNRFGTLLVESSSNGKLNVEKLALPHLIGPFDSAIRLLPRIFLKLLKNEEVIVKSPEEVFCFADVRDVADHLVRKIASNDFSQTSDSVLFPFHALQLGEIVNRFLLNENSKSRIHFESGGKNFNPTLILKEQPPLMISSRQTLRSLDSTFADIARWLSEPKRIDNL